MSNFLLFYSDKLNHHLLHTGFLPTKKGRERRGKKLTEDLQQLSLSLLSRWLILFVLVFFLIFVFVITIIILVIIVIVFVIVVLPPVTVTIRRRTILRIPLLFIVVVPTFFAREIFITPVIILVLVIILVVIFIIVVRIASIFALWTGTFPSMKLVNGKTASESTSTILITKNQFQTKYAGLRALFVSPWNVRTINFCKNTKAPLFL